MSVKVDSRDGLTKVKSLLMRLSVFAVGLAVLLDCGEDDELELGGF